MTEYRLSLVLNDGTMPEGFRVMVKDPHTKVFLDRYLEIADLYYQSQGYIRIDRIEHPASSTSDPLPLPEGEEKTEKEKRGDGDEDNVGQTEVVLRHCTGGYFIESDGITGWADSNSRHCKVFNSLADLEACVDSDPYLAKIKSLLTYSLHVPLQDFQEKTEKEKEGNV